MSAIRNRSNQTLIPHLLLNRPHPSSLCFSVSFYLAYDLKNKSAAHYYPLLPLLSRPHRQNYINIL